MSTEEEQARSARILHERNCLVCIYTTCEIAGATLQLGFMNCPEGSRLYDLWAMAVWRESMIPR